MTEQVPGFVSFSFDEDALRKIVQHEIETFVSGKLQRGQTDSETIRLQSERIRDQVALIGKLEVQLDEERQKESNLAKDAFCLANWMRHNKCQIEFEWQYPDSNCDKGCMTITVFNEKTAYKMLIPRKDTEDSLGTMFEKAVRNLKQA